MLFLGGRRDADELLAEFDAVGLGVEDILIIASSCDMSAILTSGEAVDIVSRKCLSYDSKLYNIGGQLSWLQVAKID